MSLASLSLLLVAGCSSEGYPTDLAYPLRADPLATQTAKEDAKLLDKPGEFPAVLFAYLPAEDRAKLLADPAKMKDSDRQQLDNVLNASFGTPAHPKVEGTGKAREPLSKLSDLLKLDENNLKKGSALYRHHCLHCHGLTGDGRGPTAPWVNPHPRDYRQGRFKFTSSSQNEGERKPRKDDLIRTIREGIEGSSMPSFRLIPDDDLDALASYVIHLSLRGETEFFVMRDALTDGSGESVEDILGGLAEWWEAAQSKLITPRSFPTYAIGSAEHRESVKRGGELFVQQSDAGCISCHTDFGRQSNYKYDAWGTIVKPSDLTTGIYRGGRRPIDLFWRIHSGINGSGMTAFGKRTPEDPSGLSDDRIWDLVNFLQVLPYPAMRKDYGIKLEAD